MHRLGLIIGLFFMLASARGQHNYKQVDSLSYVLYSKAKWQELADFGKEIEPEEFDFYLLNLRLGLAYYNLKKYKNALVFFEKAYSNDSTSQVVIVYLMWSYYFEEDFDNADFYYNKLDKQHQKESGYIPFKRFDFIYAESGLNVQQKGVEQTKQQQSLPYLNLGLGVNLNCKLNLYTAYFFQNQKYSYETIDLHRAYFRFSYKMKNSRVLSLGINALYSINDIDFSNVYTDSKTEENLVVDSYVYDRITTVEVLEREYGRSNEKAFAFVLGGAKYYHKLKINPFFGVSYSNVTNTRTYSEEGTENVVYLYEGEEVYNEDFEINNVENQGSENEILEYSLGLNTGYDVTPKIGVGLEISSNFKTFHFIPTLLFKASKRYSLLFEFVNKDEAPLYYYIGSQFITTYNQLQRLSLQSQFELNKKIKFYLVFQHDNVILPTNSLRSNTGLLGVKMQL